jgi:hypothetical protein
VRAIAFSVKSAAMARLKPTNINLQLPKKPDCQKEPESVQLNPKNIRKKKNKYYFSCSGGFYIGASCYVQWLKFIRFGI